MVLVSVIFFGLIELFILYSAIIQVWLHFIVVDGIRRSFMCRLEVLPFFALLFHPHGVKFVPLANVHERLLKNVGDNWLEPLADQQLAPFDGQEVVELP